MLHRGVLLHLPGFYMELTPVMLANQLIPEHQTLANHLLTIIRAVRPKGSDFPLHIPDEQDIQPFLYFRVLDLRGKGTGSGDEVQVADRDLEDFASLGFQELFEFFEGSFEIVVCRVEVGGHGGGVFEDEEEGGDGQGRRGFYEGGEARAFELVEESE